MKINNGLSLVRHESGFLFLALNGKVIPGQCALSFEDHTTPNSEQRCMSVKVFFEVFEDRETEPTWKQQENMYDIPI